MGQQFKTEFFYTFGTAWDFNLVHTSAWHKLVITHICFNICTYFNLQLGGPVEDHKTFPGCFDICVHACHAFFSTVDVGPFANKLSP